jgi:hypothetical protein
VHGVGTVGGTHGDSDLRVVDAGEVAGTGGLVLLGLEREGVGVDTGVGGTGVVLEGLDLVEVLTLLLLETVLAVKHELEGGEGTDGILSEGGGTADLTETEHGRTEGGGGDEAVGVTRGGVKLDIGVEGRGGEIPHGVLGGGVGEAPHELLDGVVVRETNLLGGSGVDGVGTGVLDLLDQVLVTLLGEATTLLSVEVDVVGPHLEGGGVEPLVEVRGQVEVETDLVVLEGNEGEVETGVAVEEEVEGEVDGLLTDTGGHLTVSGLLGLIEVKLGVQTPPLLVLLVDALTTDGKLDVVDGTLGHPRGAGLGDTGLDLELDVHVADEITVAGNGDGHTTGVSGSTVDGLLDVLHREVGVALVFRLEEGHLRVTGKVNILGTVSYELHETTGHFESCCTISRENNFGGMRISRPQFFSDQNIMTTYPDEIPDDVEEGEILDSGSELDIDPGEDDFDVAELMNSLFSTEDGDTVCTALVGISNQIQVQNKILVKILAQLQSMKN